jgi:hypothetical protein
MSKDSWDRARLIPTSGINGADEQERRAVSVLLAVIGGVREFGRAVIQPLGAPAGVIETFIDVSFGIGERKCVPDGLIRVRHGQRCWTALVEVRTGGNALDVARLETLVEVAHGQCFDAVLTVSTELPATTGPVVDQRKLRDVVLQHDSWSQLLAEAVAQRERALLAEEPSHPDQTWVLAELIRYLQHPRSGALADRDGAQFVRGVDITHEDAVVATALPESREPVDVDLRDPQITVRHTVLIAEPAVRKPPTLPSRREVRLVRQLAPTTGEQAAARNDAGWYQDPEDAGQLRWWDGVGWSERTYPGQPALA